MYRCFILALTLSGSVTSVCSAQDTQPLVTGSEAHYFDFWEGTWRSFLNGRVDTAGTWFQVRRGVHEAAFEEVWRLRIDSTTELRARAFRAWDKTTERWMFVGVSDNGLFQVWEGRKVALTGISIESSAPVRSVFGPVRHGSRSVPIA